MKCIRTLSKPLMRWYASAYESDKGNQTCRARLCWALTWVRSRLCSQEDRECRRWAELPHPGKLPPKWGRQEWAMRTHGLCRREGRWNEPPSPFPENSTGPGVMMLRSLCSRRRFEKAWGIRAFQKLRAWVSENRLPKINEKTRALLKTSGGDWFPRPVWS